MQLYSWHFLPDYDQQVGIEYLRGDFESLSMPTSQFLPMVKFYSDGYENENIEDYLRIEFNYDNDWNTTYSAIRCEELIDRMTDLSEDERS